MFALLVLLAAQDVAPDAAASREADMFGGDNAATSESPAEASPLSPVGGPVGSTVGNALTEITNTTDVGGNLFLRFNANLRQDESLMDMTPSSPSLFDGYIDARPNDRVRGFAQVRLTYDMTVESGETNLFGQPQEPFRVLFDQAWLKFDVGRIAYITAGKQRIRWGTGRFWNPTDFINQDVRNSVDFFDQRLGVDLLKVHFPFEALGWNLYVLGVFGGIDKIDDSGVAARAEFVVGQTELAISSLVRNDAPLRAGIDISTGVWLFDVRGEATVQRGLAVKKFDGDLDFDAGTFPEELDVEDDWFANVVLGADIQLPYTDQDTVIIGGEYFYNQAGYASAAIYPFLILNNAFVPLYLGQHYAGVYATAPSPFSFNDTTVTLSTLGNLSDRSFLSRLDVQQQVLSWITLNAFAAVHYGRRGEFKLGIDIPPIPTVPQLVDGFELNDDLLDVGVALRMEL